MNLLCLFGGAFFPFHFLFYFIFWKFIEAELIDSVVMFSAIQQCDSVIHIYTSIIFQILFPYRLSQNVGSSSLCYVVGPSLTILCFSDKFLCLNYRSLLLYRRLWFIYLKGWNHNVIEFIFDIILGNLSVKLFFNAEVNFSGASKILCYLSLHGFHKHLLEFWGIEDKREGWYK